MELTQGGRSVHSRLAIVAASLVLLSLCWAQPVHAQTQNYPWPYQYQRFYYYPFYYFPHNYWPQMGPKYPEGPNQPYMRPPAYMAYPPFREPNWHYEMFSPQRYYRGFHFWLDQF
jgi:hypothetical protein